MILSTFVDVDEKGAKETLLFEMSFPGAEVQKYAFIHFTFVIQLSTAQSTTTNTCVVSPVRTPVCVKASPSCVHTWTLTCIQTSDI